MTTNSTSKTVFISPLDWGLGHATRIIPIIEYYVNRGDTVVLGGNGSSLIYLQKRFPNLTCEEIPGYEVKYSKKIGFALKMVLSLPRISKGIKLEHFALEKLHKKYKFDLVVSDNRYGLYIKGVKSLLVCHQLNIRFPYFVNSIFKVQKKLIEQFDYCLIPDFPLQENLAGELSVLKENQKLDIPVRYVGALSRFYNEEMHVQPEAYTYDFVAVLSGPEPHKSSLTNVLITEFAKSKKTLAILTYDFAPTSELPSNVSLFLDCEDEQFLDVVSRSETFVSRSGYSTLMDLIYLKKKVFFIPTPGQTEQFYLTQYAADKGWCNYCTQEDFSIDKIQGKNKGFPFGKSPLNVVLGKIS